MTELIALAPQVQAALAENQPVVALESTLITHGLFLKVTGRPVSNLESSIICAIY